MQVSAEITDVNSIAERLRSAREEAEITQEELAMRAGVSQGTIGNIEVGLRRNPRELLAIAAALNVTPQWLKTGRGPRKVTPLSGWVPQGVSSAPTILPPKMAWGDMMVADDLPSEFVLEMPDDALATSTKRGTKLIFSTTAKPEPGLGVLVEDASGRRYIRRYAEGLSGGWEAHADSDAYLKLESARDGLRILAVMTGRLVHHGHV